MLKDLQMQLVFINVTYFEWRKSKFTWSCLFDDVSMLYFFFEGSKFYGMEQSLSESLQSLSEIPFKIIYYYVTDTVTYFFLTIPTTYFFKFSLFKTFQYNKVSCSCSWFLRLYRIASFY